MKRLYFAGKVTSNGWREEIVSVRNGVILDRHLRDSELKDIEIPIDDTSFLYCGPILLGDDHSSYHGESTHGAGVGVSEYAVMSDVKPLTQKQLFKLCMACIDKADAIFCYIDDTTVYGTLFELGYAYGQGKPIYLYFSDKLTKSQINDFWFSSVKAVRKKRVSSAREAFEEFKTLYNNPDTLDDVLRKEWLESPATIKQLHYIKILAENKKIKLTNIDLITKPLASEIIAVLKTRKKTVEIPEELNNFLSNEA